MNYQKGHSHKIKDLNELKNYLAQNKDVTVQKAIKKLTKTHSKEILSGKIISMTNNTPDTQTNVIELFDVKKLFYMNKEIKINKKIF